MTTPRLSLGAAALGSATLLGLWVGTPAHAGPPACDALVVDEARLLDAGGTSQVSEAAQRLEREGAQARVRTVTALPAGGLDAWADAQRRACPSWQALDTGWRNNLVVLAVAPGPRQTGLYYGGQWRGALDAAWPDVQADSTNPRFRDGRYAEGMVAGLDDVRGRITTPAAAQTDADAGPSLGARLADWAQIALIPVLVLVAALTLLRTRQRRRRAQHRRAQAAQTLRHARSDAESAFLTLDQRTRRLPAAGTPDPGADVTAARERADNAAAAYLRVKDEDTLGEKLTGVPAAQLNTQTARWRAAHDALAHASTMTGTLLRRLENPPRDAPTPRRQPTTDAAPKPAPRRTPPRGPSRPSPRRSGGSSSTYGGGYVTGGSYDSGSSGSSYGGSSSSYGSSDSGGGSSSSGSSDSGGGSSSW